jgi:hypothetical protein
MDGSLAKYGYTSTPQETPGQDYNLEMENASNKASRRSWERLIQKVYEVDPCSFVESQNYTGMPEMRP